MAGDVKVTWHLSVSKFSYFVSLDEDIPHNRFFFLLLTRKIYFQTQSYQSILVCNSPKSKARIVFHSRNHFPRFSDLRYCQTSYRARNQQVSDAPSLVVTWGTWRYLVLSADPRPSFAPRLSWETDAVETEGILPEFCKENWKNRSYFIVRGVVHHWWL